jgi:uncharacterized membrane protein
MANPAPYHPLSPEELELLAELRSTPPALSATPRHELTFGQRMADRLTALVGSWNFVLIQTLLLVLWIIVNVWAWTAAWDPYPFILLNLLLSFQAAYTAPVIMMSQNRQALLDRRAAENDFRINIKAELEIELLHQKIDLLREQEIASLISSVKTLEQRLHETKGPIRP